MGTRGPSASLARRSPALALLYKSLPICRGAGGQAAPGGSEASQRKSFTLPGQAAAHQEGQRGVSDQGCRRGAQSWPEG